MNVNEVVANRAQVLKGLKLAKEQFIKAMMMSTNHNLQTIPNECTLLLTKQ
jgi:fumarate hydratase class II